MISVSDQKRLPSTFPVCLCSSHKVISGTFVNPSVPRPASSAQRHVMSLCRWVNLKPQRLSGTSSFGHWTEDPAFPNPAISCMPVWRRRWPCSLRELLASQNSRAGPAGCHGDMSFHGANGGSVWAPVLITRPGAATVSQSILQSRLLPLTPAHYQPRGPGVAGREH